MLVRGKPLVIRRHAHDGMMAERPAIRTSDVAEVLEHPDHDQDGQAWKRHGGRTIIVYYTEGPDAVHVRAVSATRRRLAT
jgi:hypothetical protein